MLESLSFYIFKIILLLATLGLHRCSKVLSGCGVWASHRSGSFCGRAPARGPSGLSSCGLWAQPPCSLWDLPRPRIKPLSLALAGGFFTTGPLGKSWTPASDRGHHTASSGPSKPPALPTSSSPAGRGLRPQDTSLQRWRGRGRAEHPGALVGAVRAGVLSKHVSFQ